MSESTYSDFVENVQAARGRVHNALFMPDPKFNQILSCHQPDQWCGAVALSGEILRVVPHTPLIDIQITDEMPDGNPRVGRMALKKILNTSRNPDTTNLPGRTFTSRGVKRVDTCPSAEQWFEQVFIKMDNPQSRAWTRKKLSVEPSWTIITDDTDEPIAIKKHIEEKSTLSLVPLTVNGITYPAGSLYRMAGDQPQRTKPGAGYRLSSQELKRVAFMRLSAFAFPYHERYPLFKAVDLPDYFRVEVRGLQDIAAQSLASAEPAVFAELAQT